MPLDIPSPIDSTNFKLDSSGTITTQQIGFRAYRNAARTINYASETDVLCDTEDYDYGNNYDTTGGRFTCDVAGRYLFCGGVGLKNAPNGSQFSISFHKNASAIRATAYITAGVASYLHATLSSIIQLEVDDFVELKVFHTYSPSLDINNSSQATWFEGIKLA